MTHATDAFFAAIDPARRAVEAHPMYARLETLADIRRLAEHHVFAVWDFMSLLKTLQRRLTCVAVPWLPPPDRAAARLINEIVLGEESDDLPGGPVSHFELYLDAMAELGADTGPITRFTGALSGGAAWPDALGACGAPAAAQAFVRATFAPIEAGCLPGVAAAFTAGREEVIPEMFTRVVAGLAARHPGRLTRFRAYLQRHIELDGDEHGPAARRLLAACCGRDPAAWRRAEEAADAALRARAALWDAVVAGGAGGVAAAG